MNRFPWLIALTLAVVLAPNASAATVFEHRDGGRVVAKEDPTVPPPETDPTTATGAAPCRAEPAPPAPRAAASAVKRAIARARSNGKITEREADRYRAIYSAARHARADMPAGRDRNELASVLATLVRIAGAGKLNSTRMPALFLQLDRNREFWSGHPDFPRRKATAGGPAGRCGSLRAAGIDGSRVVFDGSQLLFQYYPGNGLQIQPLGNFGRANAMYDACAGRWDSCDERAFRKLLDELVAIRSNRGGFTTWEYWFPFGGGVPPWTSGMASATGIQALARGSLYFGERRYMKVARSALGVFRRSVPVGVRVRGLGGGMHYTLYSFAGGLRVLNGFAQTLNALYDFHLMTRSERALKLFRAGHRSLRRELPRYDTGAWTRYSLGGAEASLEYHELATGFLDSLCDRSRYDVYCRYARRFARYLTSPARLDYQGPRTARRGSRVVLRFWLSKVSSVVAKVHDSDGDRVYRESAHFSRGRHTDFVWAPRSRGRHRLSFTIRDPRGNLSGRVIAIQVE